MKRSRNLSTLAALLAASIAAAALAATAGATRAEKTAFAFSSPSIASAAAQPVKIGVIYPLSGSSAATGKAVLNGVLLAQAIVNGRYPNIKLPLAATAGLPNLRGAKIQIVVADHEGNPEKGASETERLVTSERVVAMIGAYFSSVTQTASERAERLRIPFVNGDSSSTALTESRKLKYFFRTGPSDYIFGQTMFEFLGSLKARTGKAVTKIAILNENTAYGTDAARITKLLAAKRKLSVVEHVAHGNNVSDVTPEATKICASRADVVFDASYTPEAILFTRTFKQLGCTPNILAYGAGYSDAAFFNAVGSDGSYSLSRAAWALEAVRARPAAVAVAKLFQRRYGQPMDENSARSFTAAMTLAYAINEARSTAPQRIRDALAKVILPASATIMPWDGIRFTSRGQNQRARGIVVQYLNKAYRVVYPFRLATAKLVWPLPKYGDR